MAQLGVAGGGAVVGGVIGFVVGGPGGAYTGAQIGWAVGGVAGALLFPPKGPNQTGPRLNDLSVQTSGFGVPIPVVAGQAKLSGNVIWSTGLREEVRRRRQGKGGATSQTTTFTYFASWAVGLCEWLIPPTNPQVLRIWLDNKLVYDTTGQSELVSVPGLSWRFYPGNETQLPDPAIEAAVGAANAPAHRGLAYIVFDDVPVEKFGNRIPNVTVEIAGESVRSFPEVPAVGPAAPLFASAPSTTHYNSLLTNNVAVDYARGRIYEGRTRTVAGGGTGILADELIRVYDLVTMETIGEYRYDRVLAPIVPLTGSVSTQGHSAAVLHVGVDGFLYVAGGTSTHVPIVKIDPDTMAAVDYFGASLDGQGASLFSSNGAYVTVPVAITSFQCPRLGATPITFLACTGNFGGCVIINADFMEYVWGDTGVSVGPAPFPGVGAIANDNPVKLVSGAITETGTDLWVIRSSLAVGAPTVFISRLRVTSGALDLGTGTALGVTRTDYADVDVVADVDASATRACVAGAFYDQSDETLVITIAGSGLRGSYGRMSTFKWQQGVGPIWALVNHVGGGEDDGRGDAGRVLASLWGRGGNLVLQPGTGDAIVNTSGATWAQTISWLDEQRAVVGWTDNRALAKRYLTRVAAVNLTVGDVVEALCMRAGLQVSDINAGALTASLRGYMLARPMSARDAITPLAAYSQFDAVEQDDVLVFRPRGGSVAATIPYGDMVRESPDALVLEEQRAQDNDLPREVTVRYADIERGWEQGAQSWSRPINPTATVQSLGTAAIDLPLPLTSTEAREVARRYTVAVWRERTRVAFSIGARHLRIVPTDVLNITTRDGATIRCRVLTTQLGANWVTRVEAVTEDAAVYGLAAVGDGGSAWQSPAMPVPYSVRLIVPDLALVEDGDDMAQAGLREYAFACAYDGNAFQGVAVIERGAGLPWEQLGVVSAPCEWGALIEPPAAPASPWIWDEVGRLRVRMTSGEPESATELEVLNGANRAALVTPDGTAEIVQWRTATQETDGTWTLTGLLRGRRGTEDLIATRGAGSAFVILDSARLLYDAAVGETTAAKQLKAVTIYQTPDTAPGPVVKAARGRAERPYAPVWVTSARDGGQNLSVSWVRRTRIGGEWLDGTGAVLLGEASEAYEMDILSGPVTGGAVCSEVVLTDGDTSTIRAYSNGLPWVITVDFGRATRIATYGWNSGAGFVLKQSPTAWTFEGWDGAAWVVLDTRSGVSAMSNFEDRSYSIASPASFLRYRWVITAATAGTFLVLGEVRLWSSGTSGPNLALATYAAAVVRTISVAAPTATYSAAQQTTDFGGAQAEVFARIYQTSGIVGRGIPVEVIL